MAIPISARWNLKWLGFFCWQKGDISNKCPLRSIWGWLLRGPYPKATLIFRMILVVCRIFLRMAACFSYSYPKNPLGDTRMEGWSVIFEGSGFLGYFYCGATGLLVLREVQVDGNQQQFVFQVFLFVSVLFVCSLLLWVAQNGNMGYVCVQTCENPKKIVSYDCSIQSMCLTLVISSCTYWGWYIPTSFWCIPHVFPWKIQFDSLFLFGICMILVYLQWNLWQCRELLWSFNKGLKGWRSTHDIHFDLAKFLSFFRHPKILNLRRYDRTPKICRNYVFLFLF